MSSARRASNPDCHNRERVLSPRGVQRSNQLSYGTGCLRFSRIKENFTTFLRKCWLITLHSSAQGIEISVFF